MTFEDSKALSSCFAEEGTVHDEGQIYRGRHAIQRWKEKADAKYRFVLEAMGARPEAETTTVRARLTGNFPGSPLEMDHIFTIVDNEIVSLEIRS